MSAIEALLGPRPEGAPEAATPRTLLIGDVFIHLKEDETREEISFYSVPGCIAEADVQAGHPDPWHDVIPHPAHPQALCAVTVDGATRQVFLSEVWPRAAVDPSRLPRLLEEHAARHDLWRQRLSAEGGWGTP